MKSIKEINTDDIKKLHNDGLLASEIAHKLCVHSPTVRAFLKKNGLKPNKKLTKQALHRQSILELYNSGIDNYTAIANKLNIHVNIVKHVLHDHNIKSKRANQLLQHDQKKRRKRLKQDELIEKLHDINCIIYNDKYDVYWKNNSIQIKCNICNSIYVANIPYLLKNGCKRCKRARQATITKEQVDKIIRKHGATVVRYPNIFSYNEKITVKCKNGHINTTTMHSFMSSATKRG